MLEIDFSIISPMYTTHLLSLFYLLTLQNENRIISLFAILY